MALFMKRKSNLIRRVQIGLTGALAFCLCMIIMIFVFQPAASGEGTPAWCGPGSWKGTAYANVFGSKVFYSIHLTLHEDGSGTLTLICDGTEMSYRMKKASTNPYDMYYIDRKDYPDDPLEDIGSVFKGNTFSFIFHNYQDADNPGWLKDGNIILLPLSCWEKPYASVSEGYHAKETVLYPIGLTMDKELIQAEYNNYDGKDYTVVRFALEESQSVWTIEDEIAEYIYLRKQDDRLQKHTEIRYPGGKRQQSVLFDVRPAFLREQHVGSTYLLRPCL